MSEKKMEEKSARNDRMTILSGIGLFAACMTLLLLMGAYEDGNLGTVFKIILFVLAFLVVSSSLVLGVFMIIRSHSSDDRETRAVAAEIEALANDASFDISEQIIFWDKLKYTKGVGSQLEGQGDEIETICRRLVNARDEIATAETPLHRLEAVLTADSILATARLLH